MNIGVADKVVELRREYPSLNAAEIARRVMVSRERVRQILKKSGLPTRSAFPRKLCRTCGHVISEGIKGKLCLRCSKQVRAMLVCLQCGRKYQPSMLGGIYKYCRDCRVVIQRRRTRLAVYRHNWERQKKSRKYHCIFCQSYFGSVGELAKHRADSGELSNLDFRKWVTTYRSTHSYWQTLEYFHISQETFKAIRDGKESPNHH